MENLARKSKNYDKWTMGIVIICLVSTLISVWVYFRGVNLYLPIWCYSPISKNEIIHKADYLYIINLDNARLSATQHPSPARVVENGKNLKPGNASKTDIRLKGKGRFLFSDDMLYFSSSDNSDPITNNRDYEIRYPLIMGEELVNGLTIIFWLGLIGLAVIRGNWEKSNKK